MGGTCRVCSRTCQPTGAPLRRCPRCKLARYCSAMHEANDAGDHRADCAAVIAADADVQRLRLALWGRPEAMTATQKYIRALCAVGAWSACEAALVAAVSLPLYPVLQGAFVHLEKALPWFLLAQDDSAGAYRCFFSTIEFLDEAAARPMLDITAWRCPKRRSILDTQELLTLVLLLLRARARLVFYFHWLLFLMGTTLDDAATSYVLGPHTDMLREIHSYLLPSSPLRCLCRLTKRPHGLRKAIMQLHYAVWATMEELSLRDDAPWLDLDEIAGRGLDLSGMDGLFDLGMDMFLPTTVELLQRGPLRAAWRATPGAMTVLNARLHTAVEPL
ncbi:hypothetical protein SDRG_14317 [Saprolegnia diclina VS20]|uniref:MYND-type domain-containing protein n=1 Tax=Saprolegnia diclina (strain VS20) TaxID=1156394 RepID=T0Q061_SAPDV|nr:hypothetical protein SDRG_14317 [Saprolegnia diclina VS20]EQC27896.1 hypothetical protein SDRG_14317 [Saprolegnia diclina VS20]|eukprot:XP_008618661.1 hypothetical protein SDRG_14317 [Saprolegnia diclina VS20]